MKPGRWGSSWLVLSLSVLDLTVGCGDDGGPSSADGTTTATTTATGGSDEADVTGSATDDGGPIAVTPTPGTWRVVVAVVEVGGLEIPFQAELTTDGSADDGSLTVTWALRAYDPVADTTSDVIGTSEPAGLSADASFTASFGDVQLPAEYSPTSTLITLASLQLDGSFSAPDASCGIVTAHVVEVDLDLAASTYGAAPWDGAAPGSSCDAMPDEPLARIDPADCPDFVEGLNTGFPSAELSRELYVYTPSDVETGGPWPVVFSYHGLGDSASWVMVGNENDLITPIDARGYILVSPESQALEGTEWQQGSTADNEDLAFFDDMITCLDAQYGVDPDRIFVTGLSAGGLYTSYLGMVRGEVVAAAAPLSGGLLVEYEAFGDLRAPYLVTWGGAGDMAVGQNFDQLAQDLMAVLDANGHFYAACDHGQGHKWPAVMTEPVLDFLFAHPRGTDPSPYASGLPGTFPDFCTLP